MSTVVKLENNNNNNNSLVNNNNICTIYYYKNDNVVLDVGTYYIKRILLNNPYFIQLKTTLDVLFLIKRIKTPDEIDTQKPCILLFFIQRDEIQNNNNNEKKQQKEEEESNIVVTDPYEYYMYKSYYKKQYNLDPDKHFHDFGFKYKENKKINKSGNNNNIETYILSYFANLDITKLLISTSYFNIINKSDDINYKYLLKTKLITDHMKLQYKFVSKDSYQLYNDLYDHKHIYEWIKQLITKDPFMITLENQNNSKTLVRKKFTTYYYNNNIIPIDMFEIEDESKNFFDILYSMKRCQWILSFPNVSVRFKKIMYPKQIIDNENQNSLVILFHELSSTSPLSNWRSEIYPLLKKFNHLVHVRLILILCKPSIKKVIDSIETIEYKNLIIEMNKELANNLDNNNNNDNIVDLCYYFIYNTLNDPPFYYETIKSNQVAFTLIGKQMQLASIGILEENDINAEHE